MASYELDAARARTVVAAILTEKKGYYLGAE